MTSHTRKLFRIPPRLPDAKEIRTDICDYSREVQRVDHEFGQALKRLEETGELDNTVIVMTGDHGWPSPRGKSNLYDIGSHVPLAIQWGNVIKPNDGLMILSAFKIWRQRF